MPNPLRIATFNLENLDDDPSKKPSLSTRIAVLRPQLARLNADVLCLQEVNGQDHPDRPRDVAALRALLAGTQYANYDISYTTTRSAREAYHERNLVVVSRFPILASRQIKHDLTDKPRYRQQTAIPSQAEASDISWERPIFYAGLDLGGRQILHVINVHFKSKMPSVIEGQKETTYSWKSVAGWAEGYFISAMKRVGQALETRMFIDALFDHDPNARIIVCGDLNADIDDVPVRAIRGMVEETGNAALGSRIMIPCELSVPEPSRYTLFHLGKGYMLDHILMSRAMVQYYKHTEIHNELLPDESGAFRTDEQFPESDHAPVVAEFMLP